MLLNFRFSNFKSYDELAHFSMITGKARKHPENFIKKENFNVLTFSALYGPNAGGKSSFIDAIGISKAMILNDIRNVRLFGRHNKNKKENKNNYSNFEYEILIDEKLYVYGFSVVLNQNKIIKEYLLDITDGSNEIIIFARENSRHVEVNYSYINVNENTKVKINVYVEDIPDSILLLKALNENPRTPLKSLENEILAIGKVYSWFDETLEVISPEEPTQTSMFSYLDEKYLKKLGKYLNDFDTGIKEVKFEKVSEDALELPVSLREKIFEDIIKTKKTGTKKGAIIKTPHNMFRILLEKGTFIIQEVRFVHNSSNITYSFEEESDGTKRIVEIFSILFDERPKVYVVDELDRSLHPNLSFKFIEKFINKGTEDQLIVSTHEDRLLDLNLLRRDQIWFVEKNSEGNSTLYSLEEYKERFDKDVQKQYLDGRYGSIPNLNFL